MHDACIQNSTEILYTQLAMVKQIIENDNVEQQSLTLDSIAAKLRGMDDVVRKLFGQVETLVRLLLTISCSSAEAERSFYGLRRLKTYLRNSMGQKRLNHLAVLNVHQEMADNIDLVAIAKDFLSKCDSRLRTFAE